jgi:hypothetical protein
MKKSRALKKLKESLPAFPSKRCVVISTYLSHIFAYFRADYSFPAITMLNLEVRPDYLFIFLGKQARLFIFKFLTARIFISKNCQPPPPHPLL